MALWQNIRESLYQVICFRFFREASGGAVVIFLSKKRKFIALYIDFWELWGAGDCQLEVARSATAEVVES